jgi:hypothetical protein
MSTYDYVSPTTTKEQQSKIVEDKDIKIILKELSMAIKNEFDLHNDDDKLIPVFERSNCAIFMVDDTKIPLVETPFVEISIVETPFVEISIVETPLVPTETTSIETPLVEISIVPTETTSIETPLVETPLVPTETTSIETPLVEMTSSMQPLEQFSESEKKENSFMESSTLTWILIIILILLGLFILNKHFNFIKF